MYLLNNPGRRKKIGRWEDWTIANPPAFPSSSLQEKIGTLANEPREPMIYTSKVNGLPVQTGDLICTTIGRAGDIAGAWWLFLGSLVPGEVDHVVVYVGPEGRCVEAAPGLGVYTFELPDQFWLVERLLGQRQIIDRLWGIAYPLQGRGFSPAAEIKVRESVAAYCLAQAAAGKPYNFNYFNSTTEASFYCSQLVYKAYLSHGINLNTGLDIPDVPGSHTIIFPQEIWSGCAHCRQESLQLV